MSKKKKKQKANKREEVLGRDVFEFFYEYAALCDAASAKGWHEANGGNLTYRLDEAQVAGLKPVFSKGRWVDLKRPVPNLSGQCFLMSASGAFLSKMFTDFESLAGVIQVNDSGRAWRTLWGFDGGANPSSELETHLAAFDVAMRAGDGADRVVYHAHGPNVIGLSSVIEPNPRAWTRALWKIMTEGVIVFPEGLGVAPWMVPGSPELAERTCRIMERHRVCIWTHHGLMSRAAGFDEVFGMVDTVEKCAGIFLNAMAANGGSKPSHLVSDDELRAICKRYSLDVNEEFLDRA